MNVNNKLISSVTWSNISSITGDTLDISSSNSLLNPKMSHVPSVKSEILTSSNNLRNILFKKKQNNQQIATSSVKQYNVNADKFDQFLMPPPVGSTIYHTYRKTQGRINMLSNGEKAASTMLDSCAQFSLPNLLSMKNISSCVSANTNISKYYPQSYIASRISTNDTQKVDRVFSRWKIMLNNQYELIIKGTLECGKIAHSKPIVRRYTATCIESKFRHKYHLEGNIVDEINELPDYIRGKFYNGFPDDWQNVHQLWRTYINQGCPITFRWPTPITDSDDDLNSEMTDLTYTRVKNDKAVPETKSYKSAEHIQSECSNNKSPKKKENYRNCSTYNSQSYEKNALFTKSFIPESENNTASIAQTRNVSLACDEDNEQNFRSNVNTSSPRKMVKLKDYIQEDKLNIIINNLVDKNCSQTYINKIVEMFDCLNYVASYETPSECSYGSMVVARQDTSKRIPQQQIVMHDNNCIKKIENRTTKLKSYVHSTDLGYESVKNDFITTHQSNPISIESEHNDNKDSGESESEIYAGIQKIPIKRVLRYRERVYKRQAERKIIPQQYATNRQHNAKEIGSESVETTNSIANAKETLFSVPYTSKRDEVMNAGRCHKATVVHQRPHETTFFINQEVLRNNVDIHDGNKSAICMQNQQFDAFDAREINLNAFMKKQKVSRGIAKFPQQQAHSQVVSDVDYAMEDSDVDVITVDTNMQKSSGSTMPYIYSDEDIVISNESNNNFPEKSHIPRRLHREFIERSKNEIAMKRSKPTITSSIPMNLNLKTSNTDLKPAQSHDSDTIVKEDKQYANNRSIEEVHTKELSTKSVIITNNSRSNMTADNKKETHPNKKNSIMNPATEQSNSDKLKNHPKVLIAWMPKVMHYAKSTYKLGLIFQGKLLNEAGHVSSRNFMTDVILKRLSETLVETVNHEFYELRGRLNNNKRNIPKKLAIQCRNGCPANIKQFCLTWETLQNDDLQDVPVDLLKAPVSSRGRKIVPSLCFWEGESISLKDDNPVYNPGSSSFTSLREESNETSNIKETKQQKIDSKNASKMQSINKQKLFESNENSNTKQIPKVKTASITKKSNNSEKSAVNGKRRIAKQLTYSSTDNDEEKVAFPCKRLCNSQPKVCADAEPLISRRTSSFHPSLQSRVSHKGTTKPNYTTYCSATKNAGNNVTYAYYKDVPVPEDSLSEDQISILGDNRTKIWVL